MQEKEIPLTLEGYKNIESKLDHFRTHMRKEVADRIRQAKEFGEIGENSEYEDAKSEQAFVEGEIIKLENILRHARIIDDKEVHTDQVAIGTVVKMKEIESGEEYEFRIVGTNESDPDKNMISNESPVGTAIMGLKKNSTVDVKTPMGLLKYKILKITKSLS